MPLLTSAQVVINTRTLRISGQTYSLGNLARVRIVKLGKPPRVGMEDIAGAFVSGCGIYLVFIMVVVGLFSADVVGSNLAGAICLFIGVPLAIALGGLIYRKMKERHISRYALMLETTGNPKISLVSTDKAELERLSVHIANAMENPPEAEQVYTVHNVIAGDQYNMVGNHNIGKWENVD